MVTSMLGRQSRQAGILMQFCQAHLNEFAQWEAEFHKHTPFLITVTPAALPALWR